MKLIKFNCILVLTWESCKIIYLGNSIHRSTDILLSAAWYCSQPAAAMTVPCLKCSRSQQRTAELISAPPPPLRCPTTWKSRGLTELEGRFFPQSLTSLGLLSGNNMVQPNPNWGQQAVVDCSKHGGDTMPSEVSRENSC